MTCLRCGRLSDRYAFQEQLSLLNPDAAAAVARMVKAGADNARRRPAVAGATDAEAGSLRLGRVQAAAARRMARVGSDERRRAQAAAQVWPLP